MRGARARAVSSGEEREESESMWRPAWGRGLCRGRVAGFVRVGAFSWRISLHFHCIGHLVRAHLPELHTTAPGPPRRPRGRGGAGLRAAGHAAGPVWVSRRVAYVRNPPPPAPWPAPARVRVHPPRAMAQGPGATRPRAAHARHSRGRGAFSEAFSTRYTDRTARRARAPV